MLLTDFFLFVETNRIVCVLLLVEHYDSIVGMRNLELSQPLNSLVRNQNVRVIGLVNSTLEMRYFPFIIYWDAVKL